MQLFKDRQDAAIQLADALIDYQNKPNTVLLALPRGGVPIAAMLATQLHLPLDIFLVRKLGAPFQEEFAIGAIASGNSRHLNEAVIASLGLTAQAIQRIEQKERRELRRRERLYRGQRPLIELANQTVILVDDGAATGLTMTTAIKAVNTLKPKHCVIALPVASPEAHQRLTELSDRIICLGTPADFQAVSVWYEAFPQVSDDEVIECLRANTP